MRKGRREKPYTTNPRLGLAMVRVSAAALGSFRLVHEKWFEFRRLSECRFIKASLLFELLPQCGPVSGCQHRSETRGKLPV